jgi:hypothetical protein
LPAAAPNAKPIPDATVVRTTIDNLEDSGVFPYDVCDWRKRPTAEHTIMNLKRHFNEADIKRLRLLSSKSAGYANHASANAVTKKPVSTTSPSVNDVNSFYCWSHGLNLIVPNDSPHNSKTCKNRAPNHCEDATLVNRMGGCNIIRSARNDRMIWKRPEPAAAKPPKED